MNLPDVNDSGSAESQSRAGLEGLYGSPAEQLEWLCRRLDLQIRRQLLLSPVRDPHDMMRFSAITDEEVDRALKHERGGDLAHGAEIRREISALTAAITDLERQIAKRSTATLHAGGCLPVTELVATLELTSLELDVLIVCVAPELDRKYERIFGYLQDDMSRHRPSMGLALSICCPDAAVRREARMLFVPEGRLLREQLVVVADETADHQSLIARPLRLEQRIVDFLLGSQTPDARIAEQLSFVPASQAPLLAAAERTTLERLRTWLDSHPQATPTFYLYGLESAAKLEIALELSRGLGLALVQVDAQALARSPVGLERGLSLSLREALLHRCALVIQHVDTVLREDASHARVLRRCLEARREVPVFMTGERPWGWPLHDCRALIPVEISPPTDADHELIWRQALAGAEVELSGTGVSELASLYPLRLDQARAALEVGKATLALRPSERLGLEDVKTACRAQAQPNLGSYARRIELPYVWSDLVVPQATLEALHDVCMQAKHRCHVYGTWGFGQKGAAGRGLHVLFAGPSGTGKTMAAQVLARELGLELYAIDLSQVVSKYIGETEKHLSQIFAAARAANVVLFFDEADALLGKRSEVRDAHDRYANIEVAYLLQKMDEHDGICMMATNLRQNLDDAFVRRIRFIVELPVPEPQERLRIWRGIWPRATPLGQDVDLESLALRHRLTGGHIRNIALGAAFMASSQGERVSMQHILTALRKELKKLGRLLEDDGTNNVRAQG